MSAKLRLLLGTLLYAYLAYALWSVGHDLRVITTWTPCDVFCLFLFGAWSYAECQVDKLKKESQK